MSPPLFPPNTMLKDQRNCALTVSTLSVGWGEWVGTYSANSARVQFRVCVKKRSNCTTVPRLLSMIVDPRLLWFKFSPGLKITSFVSNSLFSYGEGRNFEDTRALTRGEKERRLLSASRVPLSQALYKKLAEKKKNKNKRACHVGGSVEERGGSVAERLERWTCNPEALSSSPTLSSSWICSR